MLRDRRILVLKDDVKFLLDWGVRFLQNVACSRLTDNCGSREWQLAGEPDH